jgi:hypothetical protein
MTTPAPHPHAPDEGRPAGRRPAPEDSAHDDPATVPKQASSPLFKIAPADPKNAFDFEDVADK